MLVQSLEPSPLGVDREVGGAHFIPGGGGPVPGVGIALGNFPPVLLRAEILAGDASVPEVSPATNC